MAAVGSALCHFLGCYHMDALSRDQTPKSIAGVHIAHGYSYQHLSGEERWKTWLLPAMEVRDCYLQGVVWSAVIAEHKQLGWKSRWSKMDGEKWSLGPLLLLRQEYAMPCVCKWSNVLWEILSEAWAWAILPNSNTRPKN